LSDGLNTHAVFIYGYLEMTWVTDDHSPDVWIGFSAGSQIFYSSFFSFTQQALRMDLNAVTNGTVL